MKWKWALWEVIHCCRCEELLMIPPYQCHDSDPFRIDTCLSYRMKHWQVYNILAKYVSPFDYMTRITLPTKQRDPYVGCSGEETKLVQCHEKLGVTVERNQFPRLVSSPLFYFFYEARKEWWSGTGIYDSNLLIFTRCLNLTTPALGRF